MVSLGLDTIRDAGQAVKGAIHRTPLLSFQTGARCRGGDRLFLKCENLQKTGAFKARGAFYFLSQMDAAERKRGVITFSSGNHGGAVSWAAREFGIKAEIFVPKDIPQSKRAAIEGYGGHVIVAGSTSLDRKQAAEKRASETGAVIIPPFDHPHIIAGQGTAGLEILDQLKDISRVWIPVGGGGLLAGVALAIKGLRSEIQVIGVEPRHAASMAAAVHAGKPTPIELGNTIADGLKPIQAGELTSEIASQCVDHLVTVDDEQIVQAMWALIERAHLVVEPSGAAALAAYLYGALENRSLENGVQKSSAQNIHDTGFHGTDVVVLSGGNIDRNRLKSLAD